MRHQKTWKRTRNLQIYCNESGMAEGCLHQLGNADKCLLAFFQTFLNCADTVLAKLCSITTLKLILRNIYKVTVTDCSCFLLVLGLDCLNH